MKKKIVSLLLTLTMAAGLISGCGSSLLIRRSRLQAPEDRLLLKIWKAVAAASSAADSGLTEEEQEAVDAGLISLDGTLPIIKDPEAFEAKYGLKFRFDRKHGGQESYG